MVTTVRDEKRGTRTNERVYRLQQERHPCFPRDCFRTALYDEISVEARGRRPPSPPSTLPPPPLLLRNPPPGTHRLSILLRAVSLNNMHDKPANRLPIPVHIFQCFICFHGFQRQFRTCPKNTLHVLWQGAISARRLSVPPFYSFSRDFNFLHSANSCLTRKRFKVKNKTLERKLSGIYLQHSHKQWQRRFISKSQIKLRRCGNKPVVFAVRFPMSHFLFLHPNLLLTHPNKTLLLLLYRFQKKNLQKFQYLQVIQSAVLFYNHKCEIHANGSSKYDYSFIPLYNICKQICTLTEYYFNSMVYVNIH